MNTSLITTIAINLGILLLISWVVCMLIFVRMFKYKSNLEKALVDARKKLKAHKSKSPPVAENSISPELPLDDLSDELELEEDIPEDENAIYLLEALNNMSSDLVDKEQQIAELAKLHAEQQAQLEEFQSNQDGDTSRIMDNHKETDAIIRKLQHDITINQRVIMQLESKLRDGQDKDGRIAILEETEKRLRARVEMLKKNRDQATLLADGLRKSLTENEKLKRNIKQLTEASKEQLATINKISTELERISKLEQHQRDMISNLEAQLREAKKLPANEYKDKELEKKLKETQATLVRTIKEKDHISSYLVEMDKALEKAKETEEALERARKEIETLEMYFPEFSEDGDDDTNEADKLREEETDSTHAPLPKLTVNPSSDPNLFHIVQDNRLYGILQDFWVTLDTPPLTLVSKNNIKRPQRLSHWVKTSIHSDEDFIAIGTTENLTKALGKAMFEKSIDALSSSDLKDALGELGNVIAGTLANELNPSYIVGISEHLNNANIENELQGVAIATEVLLSANKEPLYIALAKPSMKP